MAFDVSTARVRAGLLVTDTSQDAAINLAMQTALSIAEKYCDRKFMYARQKGSFYYVARQNFQLDRYPIESVFSLSDENGTTVDATDYEVHHLTGMVQFPSVHSVPKRITIEWEGGYRQLPFDLEMALWGAFDTVWPSISGAGGGTVAAGEIESVTLQDVGTVRFTTQASVASGAGASNASSGAYGLMGPYFSLLDKYRLESA